MVELSTILLIELYSSSLTSSYSRVETRQQSLFCRSSGLRASSALGEFMAAVFEEARLDADLDRPFLAHRLEQLHDGVMIGLSLRDD